MAQPVIYLDNSMLLNFTMDYIILFLTSRISGYRVGYGRLVAGAVLGSLYILVIFLPEIAFLYNMAVKFLYSCLIILVCFFPLNPKKFLACLGYFYAVSFAIGGAVYGFSALSSDLQGQQHYELLTSLIAGGGNLVAVLAWGFPLALVFWFGLGRWGWSALKRSLAQVFFKYPLCIHFGEVEVSLDGLLDTGNHLRDPFSKKPVVVVEASLLLPYLPAGFSTVLESCDLAGLDSSLGETHWATRLCLIPYSSVGKQNGLLVGFIPDVLVIRTPAGEVKTDKIIIGLYTQKLSPDGAYRALLHPELLVATS